MVRLPTLFSCSGNNTVSGGYGEVLTLPKLFRHGGCQPYCAKKIFLEVCTSMEPKAMRRYCAY